MLIPLDEWAKRRYMVPPTHQTLLRWVREGQIHPAPERAGRMYQVDEHAVRLVADAAPVAFLDRVRMKAAA